MICRVQTTGNVQDSALPGKLYSPILPERAYGRGDVQGREAAYAVCHESLPNLENVLLGNRKITSNSLWTFQLHSVAPWIKQQSSRNDSVKLITWSGRSSNALPPMLNATECRESMCLQSTCDPTGSGMFSQSCQSTHLLVRHVWCTNTKTY